MLSHPPATRALASPARHAFDASRRHVPDGRGRGVGSVLLQHVSIPVRAAVDADVAVLRVPRWLWGQPRAALPRVRHHLRHDRGLHSCKQLRHHAGRGLRMCDGPCASVLRRGWEHRRGRGRHGHREMVRARLESGRPRPASNPPPCSGISPLLPAGRVNVSFRVDDAANGYGQAAPARNSWQARARASEPLTRNRSPGILTA